ncbi:MAG: TlpA family protein disulfide reductase [Chloroflexota bacterium]
MWIVTGLWVGVCLGAVVIGGLLYNGSILDQRGGSQAASSGPALAKMESGTPADDFALPDLAGKTVRLSDFRGKVVVFNFWATWCGPCVEEMPIFERYQQQYPGFVMIGIDTEETAEQVQAFLKTTSINYLILVDQQAEAAEQYRVQLLPTTIIVDANGEIRYRHYGVLSAEQLDYYLTSLGVIPE